MKNRAIGMIAAFVLIAVAVWALIVGDLHQKHKVSWSPISNITEAIALWVLIVSALVYMFLVYPSWSIDNLRTRLGTVKFDRALELHKAEREARDEIVKLIAGAVLLGGLYFTYSTLTDTARSVILQRYSEAAKLLRDSNSSVEKLAGVQELIAIDREPEASDLNIKDLLKEFVKQQANPNTASTTAHAYAP
jgi:hypothetical protein